MIMMQDGLNIHDAAFTGDVRQVNQLLKTNKELANDKDEMNQSPLHKAAMNGWCDIVKILVQSGSQVNAGDISGCTPLHYSAGNGYLEISRYLVEQAHANMAQKTNKGHTPRYMAKSRGQITLVAFFNEMENKIDGNTWLS